jgi:hypothetical protein
MSAFKVGDKVRYMRPNDEYYAGCLTVGKVYEVIEISGDCTRVRGDNGQDPAPFSDRFDPVTETKEEYLINGSNAKFNSIKDAEEFITGNCHVDDGGAFTIALVVKRVKVKRETVITLEAV